MTDQTNGQGQDVSTTEQPADQGALGARLLETIATIKQDIIRHEAAAATLRNQLRLVKESLKPGRGRSAAGPRKTAGGGGRKRKAAAENAADATAAARITG